MSMEIKVPVLPESVADGSIATWYKKVGEKIKRDEHLLDIETDKVVLEVVAPADGFLEKILKKEGDTVKSEEVVGLFTAEAVLTSEKNSIEVLTSTEKPSVIDVLTSTEQIPKPQHPLSPSVRQLVKEQNVNLTEVQGTGKDGRITKADVTKVVSQKEAVSKPPSAKKAETSALELPMGERVEKRVPMSRLRARMAERLLQAQQSAAILTTFNEINMQPVMGLRQKYKETFEKDYGVRLGFMSFFTIAVVEALKRFPIVNASVDGNDIIYHGYHDIGIAVSSPRGLVVPLIRNAELLDMAQIERKIAEFKEKAQNGQLTIEEISGGTFTISNAGGFGSLMSTPILNPPQSGILGMHKIEERPIVENGVIVIRPMMYVAMSYDHRIIDGTDAVQFLVTVKELIEDPARLLLNV
ncbi:MAG TPA: 2-oxoglutarate dehydrogenase complex dihydrolipoyllysine-residue succinyltransferase [Gammaproteobacteria bacterium]|nr:2-oxoglutarate dehydrogenase complex dihydrolipoyllysine-residue succinyltransferase [Gammaproteobacteria bacterium]